MKKYLILAFALATFQAGFCSNTIETKTVKDKEIKKQKENVGPVACCWSRASSGTYGQSDYNAVRVQACATSDVSYQDAQINACAKADMAAQKALQIAENTLSPTKP